MQRKGTSDFWRVQPARDAMLTITQRVDVFAVWFIYVMHAKYVMWCDLSAVYHNSQSHGLCSSSVSRDVTRMA